MTEQFELNALVSEADIKNRACELYVEGVSLRKIAHQISTEFSTTIKVSTVRSWADNSVPPWRHMKADIQSRAVETFVSNKSQELAQRDQAYVDLYDSIIEKAQEELEINIFDKAGDAVTAIDKSIRSQRQILAGMIHYEFMKDIISILKNEVEDEETLRRIALAFKGLLAKSYD